MLSKIKWNRNTLAYVLAFLLIVAATFFLVGAFGEPNEDFTDEPLFVDTNVKSISINKEYIQNNTEFNLISLEVGDNYTVLLFESPTGTEIITGADLYQNGIKLKYLSAGTATNKYVDSAIAFEPTNGYENLELRISNLEVSTKTFVYSLDYSDNVATVEINNNGQSGLATISLSSNECTLTLSEELSTIMKSSIEGYPIVPGSVILLKDGENINTSNYEYSIDNPPDEIKITFKEAIISGDPTIIKIS